MAYNNGFPMSYPYYMPAQQPQQNQSGIIWVQGEAGAKSYLVAPNTTVQLWDSEAQVIYLKSADASGMPNIKTLDYTIRETQRPVAPVAANDYVTKEDLKAQLDALRKELAHEPSV